jgi:hypothetical protein
MVRSGTTNLIAALLLAACGSSEAPDLIFHNAKVFTATVSLLTLVGGRVVHSAPPFDM